MLACLRLTLAVLLCAALPAHANEYLSELVQRAHEKNLAARAEWHALLHYRPNLLTPGVTSQADDTKFFNAPSGKTDPAAELDATLAAFFSDREETDKTQNPQCAFIARYRWLKTELDFDFTRLPERDCARFRTWRAALDPQALTLVFPAAYLNNPSSMFGHTLLRIDAAAHTEQSRLLGYAVNYAAATEETNGALFAVKGIFGGYGGLFSIAPYYMKVKEYSDLENRDIWEYELNFTPAEIDRLLMHAWELGPIYFDYYFFDENCSYHLLSLLDVGRPGLRLTDRFQYGVIPADTVRVIADEPNLVRRTVFRPAAATRLRHRLDAMSPALRAEVMALADGTHKPDAPELMQLAPAQRADALETAYEYVRYEVAARKRANPEAAALSRELLLARSRVDAPRQEPPVPPPTARPEHGHKTARAALGGGAEDARGFIDLKWRPAYHDILDADAGYTAGAQINFVDIELRYERAREDVRLERLTLIDIVSLAPRDAFFRPLSWKVGTGVDRIRRRNDDGGADEGLAWRVAGGPGWVVGDARALVYGFVDGDVVAGGTLAENHSVGVGASVGTLLGFGAHGKLHVFARALDYRLGERHRLREAGAEYRVPLSRAHALNFKYTARDDFGEHRPLWSLALHWYL